VLRAGGSPLYPDEKAQPVDWTQIVSCSCCSPARRFLNAEWLAAHVEGLTADRAAREAANAQRRNSHARQKMKA
jgi:hypothetical protein